MIVTKRLDLPLLADELAAALVIVNGLGTFTDEAGTNLHTYAPADGAVIDVPPEAGPVVDAHVAPPLLGEFADAAQVYAIARTTDDQAHEVFRFPCEERRRYTANLTISGVDAASFVSRDMEGRFVWKRITGNAIMVGITVVSTLGEAGSASWAPNALPEGTDIVFTVKGAAGRTIDWLLVGEVDVYAPGGLA